MANMAIPANQAPALTKKLNYLDGGEACNYDEIPDTELEVPVAK